ncbi:hypothetical protein D4764_18G0003800 [Takifugu flavidus]|uniref:Uncharacterized protein n=1 Tax=Takifugu flavidus TaxID=433684 RepID=A0A5C6NQ76_9TELE|nr:hypothetical protein D4764_18G0003800 [Takifugu flavidus]
MVVEVTGESGEVGKEMDPTGVAFEVLGGLGETGDGMSEISELGEAGEMGDMGQTGEQGVAVGDVGQETGERGVQGKRLASLKSWTAEDAAAATDTSDQEHMSDASELSNTVADSERDDLYPPSMIKNFLMKTKGMRGPDLGSYFPDKLLFIQSAGHWIKHRVVSDLTDPETFRLKKHMGKARKQLRELSNESTSSRGGEERRGEERRGEERRGEERRGEGRGGEERRGEGKTCTVDPIVMSHVSVFWQPQPQAA